MAHPSGSMAPAGQPPGSALLPREHRLDATRRSNQPGSRSLAWYGQPYRAGAKWPMRSLGSSTCRSCCWPGTAKTGGICPGATPAIRTRFSSSEVMLQQTQVARVVPRYLAWLERWPTAAALAAATPAEVIIGLERPGVQPAGRAICTGALVRWRRWAGSRESRGSSSACPASGRTRRPRSPALPSAPRSPRPTRTPAGCSAGCTAKPRWPPARAGVRVESGPLRSRPRGVHRPHASLWHLSPRGGMPVARDDVRAVAAPIALRGIVQAAARAACCGRSPMPARCLTARPTPEALVSLVRDGLAEVRDGHARLPGG